MYPYRLARLDEQFDATGSRRRLGTVEPAEWKVQLLRISAWAFVLLGAVVVPIGLAG